METPFQSIPTQRCLVYDKRTGQVIHIHDFIGADPKSRLSTSELETQALTYSGDQIKKEHMAVVEATGDLGATDITYSVDTGTGSIIETPLGHNPSSLREDRPVEDSPNLEAIKRSLSSWKTISIIALLVAIAAVIVGWLL